MRRQHLGQSLTQRHSPWPLNMGTLTAKSNQRGTQLRQGPRTTGHSLTPNIAMYLPTQMELMHRHNHLYRHAKTTPDITILGQGSPRV